NCFSRKEAQEAQAIFHILCLLRLFAAKCFRPRHARSLAEHSGKAEILAGVLEHVARVALRQSVSEQAREHERQQRQNDPSFLAHDSSFFALTETARPPRQAESAPLSGQLRTQSRQS